MMSIDGRSRRGLRGPIRRESKLRMEEDDDYDYRFEDTFSCSRSSVIFIFMIGEMCNEFVFSTSVIMKVFMILSLLCSCSSSNLDSISIHQPNQPLLVKLRRKLHLSPLHTGMYCIYITQNGSKLVEAIHKINFLIYRCSMITTTSKFLLLNKTIFMLPQIPQCFCIYPYCNVMPYLVVLWNIFCTTNCKCVLATKP